MVGDGRPAELAIDGYREFRRIAFGGFSTVYTAYEERFDRIVAVKVLNAEVTDPEVARRFAAECRAAGGLSHIPEIATAYDAGVSADGRPFIAMQYFRRGSLAALVTASGPLAAAEVVEVAAAAAGALSAAHAAGRLHRDVKPGNLLVTDDGGVVLADFGVARVGTGPGGTASLDAFTPSYCPLSQPLQHKHAERQVPPASPVVPGRRQDSTGSTPAVSSPARSTFCCVVASLRGT